MSRFKADSTPWSRGKFFHGILALALSRDGRLYTLEMDQVNRSSVVISATC